MTAARFFTDEDVFGDVAVGLRKNGFDAVSTPEVGRLTEDDESHLQWAAHEGRVLVTFNVGDFVKLHGDWLRSDTPCRNHRFRAASGRGDSSAITATGKDS